MSSLVYFDMDGVLADFALSYDQLINRHKPNGDVIWEEVEKHARFFLDLPLMPMAREIWNVVPADSRRILSAVAKSIDQCASHKREWLKANFGFGGDAVILVRSRHSKQIYARPGDILVDDWRGNIVEWERNGGIGIWYQSGQQVIEDLREHLGVYHSRPVMYRRSKEDDISADTGELARY